MSRRIYVFAATAAQREEKKMILKWKWDVPALVIPLLFWDVNQTFMIFPFSLWKCYWNYTVSDSTHVTDELIFLLFLRPIQRKPRNLHISIIRPVNMLD